MPFTAICALSSLGLFDPSRPEPENDWIAVAFGVFGLVFFARSLFLSVYLTPEHVIVRSWFTTRRHPIAANLVFTVDTYSGWLNQHAEQGWLATVFVRNGAGQRPVKGLLALRGSALRQVRIINDHVTAELPALRRDLGPAEGYQRDQSKHALHKEH